MARRKSAEVKHAILNRVRGPDCVCFVRVVGIYADNNVRSCVTASCVPLHLLLHFERPSNLPLQIRAPNPARSRPSRPTNQNQELDLDTRTPRPCDTMVSKAAALAAGGGVDAAATSVGGGDQPQQQHHPNKRRRGGGPSGGADTGERSTGLDQQFAAVATAAAPAASTPPLPADHQPQAAPEGAVEPAASVPLPPEPRNKHQLTDGVHGSLFNMKEHCDQIHEAVSGLLGRRAVGAGCQHAGC